MSTTVFLSGTFRRRKTSGVGPFKKQRWDSVPFEWSLTADGDNKHLDGLKVTRHDHPNSIDVDALVKGIPCFLASFRRDSRLKRATFNLISVGGVELQGYVEILEGEVSDSPAAT